MTARQRSDALSRVFNNRTAFLIGRTLCLRSIQTVLFNSYPLRKDFPWPSHFR